MEMDVTAATAAAISSLFKKQKNPTSALLLRPR
jgi:hypothetical protein